LSLGRKVGNVLPGLSNRRRPVLLPYLLIAPLLVFIGGLALYPTVLTFVNSFYIVNPIDPPQRFAGLTNYADLFADSEVVRSWVNTVFYVVIGVVVSTLLALVMAIGLRKQFSGRAVVLAILVLPWALPGITEGIIWDWIYNPSFGVLNSVLHSLHLIDHYQLWISGNRLATIFFIELVQIWQMTPLSAILILASLQGIPLDIYDAAAVDGASRWEILRRITLPLIRPGIAIAVVESFITSLNIFDQVYVLNGSSTTASSVMLETYNITFQDLNFGQGYAMSFMAVFVTMLACLALLKVIYKKVEF
jgi:multiple sugar transport system permease protein